MAYAILKPFYSASSSLGLSHYPARSTLANCLNATDDWCSNLCTIDSQRTI